ncbi:MAG: hypothetical protein JO194_04160 [Candidatus Eremiobacteraeota bacterium]|nr:hypothetical protein [Candidatus Eremiobacteraeota bacterium]
MLAAAIALALLAYPPQTTTGVLPDLAIGFNPPDGPGYVVASKCEPGKPLITFLLVISNVGSVNSQPIKEHDGVTIAAVDDPAWSAGAPLGAIAAGHIEALNLSLPARPGLHGPYEVVITVNGRQEFEENSFANNTARVTVTIPPGLCPSVWPGE